MHPITLCEKFIRDAKANSMIFICKSDHYFLSKHSWLKKPTGRCKNAVTSIGNVMFFVFKEKLSPKIESKLNIQCKDFAVLKLYANDSEWIPLHSSDIENIVNDPLGMIQKEPYNKKVFRPLRRPSRKKK